MLPIDNNETLVLKTCKLLYAQMWCNLLILYGWPLSNDLIVML